MPHAALADVLLDISLNKQEVRGATGVLGLRCKLSPSHPNPFYTHHPIFGILALALVSPHLSLRSLHPNPEIITPSCGLDCNCSPSPESYFLTTFPLSHSPCIYFSAFRVQLVRFKQMNFLSVGNINQVEWEVTLIQIYLFSPIIPPVILYVCDQHASRLILPHFSDFGKTMIFWKCQSPLIQTFRWANIA